MSTVNHAMYRCRAIHNPTWGLIRFGTGDMSLYTTDLCPCGRTSYKITRIIGRTSDAVKIRGMFVIAKQVEQFFSEFNEITRYQLIVGRREERDELLFKIELKDEPIDKVKLSHALTDKFPKVCKVRPDSIEFVSKGTIPEDHKTILDERKWK